MFKILPLMEGARTAVEVCMNVKPEETVLIMTDTGKVKLAEALFQVWSWEPWSGLV